MGDSVRDKEGAEYAAQVKQAQGEGWMILFYLFVLVLIMGVSGFLGWTWGQDVLRREAAKERAGEFVLTGNADQTEFKWRVCSGTNCINCGLFKEGK